LLVSLLSLNTTLILQMAHSRFIIQVLWPAKYGPKFDHSLYSGTFLNLITRILLTLAVLTAPLQAEWQYSLSQRVDRMQQKYYTFK
jgi:hypothetical protein